VEQSSQRLDRIEEKIDKLSDAMISLARAEERLIAIEKQNFATYERMNKHSVKIDDIDDRVARNENTILIINKVFWIAVTFGIGAVIALTTGVSIGG
jgi:hypothetical protein